MLAVALGSGAAGALNMWYDADIDAVTLAFRRLVNLVPGRGLLLLGADSPSAAALKAAAGL